MFNSFPIIEEVIFSGQQSYEAEKIAIQRKVPFGDALHAIIARDCDAILVSRDQHYEKLTDITLSKKPEELL